MAAAGETATAVNALIDLLGRLDQRFTAGERALTDEASLLEGIVGTVNERPTTEVIHL